MKLQIKNRHIATAFLIAGIGATIDYHKKEDATLRITDTFQSAQENHYRVRAIDTATCAERELINTTSEFPNLKTAQEAQHLHNDLTHNDAYKYVDAQLYGWKIGNLLHKRISHATPHQGAVELAHCVGKVDFD